MDSEHSRAGTISPRSSEDARGPWPMMDGASSHHQPPISDHAVSYDPGYGASYHSPTTLPPIGSAALSPILNRLDLPRWDALQPAGGAGRQAWGQQPSMGPPHHVVDPYGYPQMRLQTTMSPSFPMSALSADGSPTSVASMHSMFDGGGAQDYRHPPLLPNQPHGTYSGYHTPATSYAPTPSPIRPDQGMPSSSLHHHQLSNNTINASQQRQQQLWKDIIMHPRNAGGTFTGPLVKQRMYRPHTNADKKRYVEDVQLSEPIVFEVHSQEQWGMLLTEAMQPRSSRLVGAEEAVFVDRGPSVSIRIEWPGYPPWSKQIPTRDFKNPPGPITRAKLAKGVAKLVKRFMEQAREFDEEEDHQWVVGDYHIRFEDLVLVSLHHVSMGSWQPHLRLRHPQRIINHPPPHRLLGQR